MIEKETCEGKGKEQKKIQFHSIRIRKTSDKPPTMLFSSTSEDMIREHQLSPFIYICTDYGVYEADQWLEIGSKSLLALFPYGRVELSMFFCFVFRQKTCPHPLSTIWIRGKMELKEVQCLVLTHSHMSVWTYLQGHGRKEVSHLRSVNRYFKFMVGFTEFRSGSACQKKPFLSCAYHIIRLSLDSIGKIVLFMNCLHLMYSIR